METKLLSMNWNHIVIKPKFIKEMPDNIIICMIGVNFIINVFELQCNQLDWNKSCAKHRRLTTINCYFRKLTTFWRNFDEYSLLSKTKYLWKCVKYTRIAVTSAHRNSFLIISKPKWTWSYWQFPPLPDYEPSRIMFGA